MKTISKNTYPFSKRSQNLPSSFIRDILKVAAQNDVISFAGGLPDPGLFPLDGLEESAQEIFRQHGKSLLQYSKTEGLPSLKEWICHYYWRTYQMQVNPDQLLITSGSQQALDLIGKAFMDPGDQLVLEQPSYLGAIQAFMAYEPAILALPIYVDGLDIEALKELLNIHQPKLLYLVPNFQNPSGFTISEAKRKELAELAQTYNLIIVEDDPYGQLRFEGEELKPIRSYYEDSILCGSFSKIIAPGLRIGWVVANEEIIRKLLVLKQASDLHSNNLSQYLADHFLRNFSFDAHLNKIRKAYGRKCEFMFAEVVKAFPANCRIMKPEGGMFLWVELPAHMDAELLLQYCMEEKVIFVPGKFFYTNGKGQNTMRLNFTNCSEEHIRKGIGIIGKAIESLAKDEFSK